MSDYERLEELRDDAERALGQFLDYAKAMIDVADKRREDAEDECDTLKDEVSKMRAEKAATPIITNEGR